MQRPTLQNVRISSTKDALHVFHAVARNVLPLIVRRLDAEERRAICPGNVYVWEERAGGNDDEATVLGMERWTDGIAWGPSRVRDEFLFYQQKEDALPDASSPSAIWDQSRKRKDQLSTSSRRLKDPLMKQTYSVYVSFPSDRHHGFVRKWHLTAYFSQQRLDDLYTVDCIPGIGNVPIPDGWFKSARARKPRRHHALLASSRPEDNMSDSPPPSSCPGRSIRATSIVSTPARYASVDMYCHRGRHYPPISPASPTMSTASGPTSSSYSSASPIVSSRRRSTELLAPISELELKAQQYRRDPRDEQVLRRLRNTLLR